MASQLASSSPLCLLDLGILLSNVGFVRSIMSRAFGTLSCVMLTPLSTLAGCTGFSLATTSGVAEGDLMRVFCVEVLLVTVVAWAVGVVDVFCGGVGDVVGLGALAVAFTVTFGAGDDGFTGSLCGSDRLGAVQSLGTLFPVTTMSFAGTSGSTSGSFCGSVILTSWVVTLSLEGTWGANVTTCCLLDARGGKLAVASGRF